MALLDGINIKLLSPIYINWYKKLVDEVGVVDYKDSTRHPHYWFGNCLQYEKKLPEECINVQLIQNKPKVININILYTNYSLLQEDFAKVRSFGILFNSLPPVSNGNMFLEVGNTPKIFIGKNSTYVVVKVKSLDEYVSNYFLMKRIFKKSGLLNIDVVNHIGFVKTEEDAYFISEFKGNDFEIEVLLNNRQDLKNLLIESAQKIEKLFNSEGIFVRNIAPRNMIYSKKKVFLIDYDHIYFIPETSIEKLWELDLQRRVWFGDILDKGDIEKIFPVESFVVDKTKNVIPDHFEKKFFNKESIQLSDREFLYKQTELLEQKAVFKHVNVHGHQLGRYISDFWEESSEVDLLRFITDFPYTLDKLRALLFITSRVDQELLFFHSYAQFMELEILGEKIFKKILVSGKIPDFEDLRKSYLNNESFNKTYILMQKLLV